VAFFISRNRWDSGAAAPSIHNDLNAAIVVPVRPEIGELPHMTPAID
jgi:hypothetical protein